MELIFDWNQERRQLTISPPGELCTREQNMAFAQHVAAIRGDDPVARDVGKYTMAQLAYEQRHRYVPCTRVPGSQMPLFMNSNDAYSGVRLGIHQLSGCTNLREREQVIEKSMEAQRAATFLEYVTRVSAVESHNAQSCGTLLMAHAWMVELNPDGDAAAIQLLSQMLRQHYNIQEPAITAAGRNAQARHHSRNMKWLSSVWRQLWERP